MRIKSLFRLAVILAAGWALLAPAFAYVFITDASNIYVVTWPPGSIPIQIKLSQTANLSDGTSQTSSVLAAMQSWNAVLGTVQLAGTPASGTYALGNGINEIAMDSAVEGESLGSGVLAVTISTRSGNKRTESDIIFNTYFSWDSYRGTLRNAEDIQRVALHELGHVLGLDHPDDYHQSVAAIMTSYVTNLYQLQSDDVNGVQALYGVPGVKPVNDSFSDATVLTLVGNSSVKVTATNIAGTREAGEPNHVGVAQGHSVWWKWTAPSSGRTNFTTYGSLFDTVMSVYTGTAVNALTLVGENDDEEPSSQYSSPSRKRTSSVVFNAVGGTTYYVAVDGWGDVANGTIPYTGAISLTLNFGGAVPPDIYSQPSDRTVYEGDYAYFTVNSGVGLLFEWQRWDAKTLSWGTLTDPNLYGGMTNESLAVKNVSLAMSGDQFRCVVSNTTGGSTVTNTVTLSVLPLPLPTVRTPTVSINGLNAIPYGGISVDVVTASSRSLTYQWYHGGVAIPGAVGSSVGLLPEGGAESGEYYVAVTNLAGTILSPTVSVGGLNPDPNEWYSRADYKWTRSMEVEGVVYFLFKNPARIARYDLASETWLPDWTLAQAASDFVIATDAIYVATGTSIVRYDRSFGSPTTLVSGTPGEVSLFLAEPYLVTHFQRGNPVVTSYSRTTGQKVASLPLSTTFGPELSYSAASRRIYGGGTSSNRGIYSITIGADGSLDANTQLRDNSTFPRTARTIVLPDGTVTDTGGIVYDGLDLTYAGSLGGPLDDVVPDGAGGYYVLRSGRISVLDNRYREIGASVGHLKTGSRMWRRNSTLYLFAQPAAAGAVPTVEKTSVSVMQAPALVGAANPNDGHFESSQWLIDEQGVVYIYSKLDRNIYRWSSQAKNFLPSIPLASSPSIVAYSAENRALYFDENGYQVRRISLDSGSLSPVPLSTTPLMIASLQTAGPLLWFGFGLNGGGLILDSAGNPGPLRDLGQGIPAWCLATRRMYSQSFGSPAGLYYLQIDAAGLVVTSKGSYDGVVMPIRPTVDGTRVVVGSGQVYDGASLARLGTLANAVSDAAWTGTGLYTVRQTSDTTEMQSWSTENWQLKGDRSFPGTPLRLLTLPDGKLLLGTMVAGKFNLRVIEPDTFAVVSGPPVSAKTAQSITFITPASAAMGDSLALSATASSGQPVQFSVVSGPATITGANITLTGTGSVVVRASQPGDETYESAISVVRSLTVKRAVVRVIAFDRTRTYGAVNPSLDAGYSGFVGKDTEAALTTKPAIVTAATINSPPGSYPITIMGGAAADYDFVYTDGTLTVTKAPLTVKAGSVVWRAGDPAPSLSVSYTGFVLGQGPSVLTSPAVPSTTAAAGSAFGVYPITVTGGSADNYEITRIDGTLRLIPASYDRTYFGTLASNGFWALQVRVDGTATYIAYLPGRSSAVVTELMVATDGSFTVTGTETKRTAQSAGVGALALASPEAPVIHPGAAAGDFTLSGQIAANGAVTGSLGGLGETFTGAAEPATGPAQALAGYYRAAALNTATGATHVIVGASGQAVVVTTTPSAVDGALGTVNTSGQLTMTTTSGTALSLAVDAASQSISASLKPAGASAPITYAGLSYGVMPDGRVVNLSVRTPAGTGSQTLIVGFVVTGAGSKALLLRGIGPGLLSQGVSNALGDPTMRLLDASGAELVANDDWGGSAQLAQLFSSLGATPLPSNSKDAALSNSIAPGVYSCHIYPSVSGTGVTLAEFYDADTAVPTANVVNLSARTQVGTGGDILIAGFVVAGNAPKTLLIRGLGPTLTGLGVTGALANPQIYLYSGPNIIANNDDWGGTTELKMAFATVGAGPLASDTSKDAALLVTLPRGVYSAQVSGVGGTTGVGLVEIYLLP